MKIDDLYFYTQVKKVLEFSHNNETYRLEYDKTIDGKDIIKFGPQYEEKKYYSFGEFLNNAKVGNHDLKYFIESL